MINRLGQVMVYVNNLEKAKEFWTEKLDFIVLEEDLEIQGLRRIEVAPKKAMTSIELTDKAFVAEMEPEMNLDTPSRMLFSNDHEILYLYMTVIEITLCDMVIMASGEKVFNVADNEDNYFVVMEK